MKLRAFEWVLCIAMLASSPAPAQDHVASVFDAMKAMSHQECMIGKPTEADFTGRDAADPVKEAMTRYWSAVSAVDSARVADVFQASGKAAWVFNGVETPARSGKVTDVFARGPGNVMVDVPLSLVRAKLGDTARGVWEVRSRSGTTIGYYLVEFQRRSNWKPLRLELIQPASGPPTVQPYCFMPGDIEAARTPLTDRQVAKLSKKARPVGICMAGRDCAEKWAMARQWVADNSDYPLIHATDTALITSGPAEASLNIAFVAALDPPKADGRQVIRFRAWCGNYFFCFTKPSDVHEAFAEMLAEPMAAD